MLLFVLLDCVITTAPGAASRALYYDFLICRGSPLLQVDQLLRLLGVLIRHIIQMVLLGSLRGRDSLCCDSLLL